MTIIRKISVLFATLGVVAAGALFPTSAQASTACDNAWHDAASGYFYAYDGANCSVLLGLDDGNDPNWGDASGAFRSTSVSSWDNNKATSILHKGTSGLAVKVYSGSSYTGNWSCIKKSEYYVSNLNDNYLTGGSGSVGAWDEISSHQWMSESDCASHFLR